MEKPATAMDNGREVSLTVYIKCSFLEFKTSCEPRFNVARWRAYPIQVSRHFPVLSYLMGDPSRTLCDITKHSQRVEQQRRLPSAHPDKVVMISAMMA